MVLATFVLVVAAVAFAAPDDNSGPPAPALLRPHGGAPTIYAGPGGRGLLDGKWRFKRDPKAIGTDKGYANGRFTGELVRIPYVPDAKKIRGRRGIETFRGAVGWYRTNVQVASSGRYAIRFESVNHKAQVYVDGKRVAAHTGEYLPFEARVNLTAGRKHRVVVRADWRSPTRMKRDGWHRLWFNFGGINREVSMRPIADSELKDPTLRTRLRPDGSAVVSVSVGVRNNAGEAREIGVKGTLTNGDRKIDVSFPSPTVGPRRGQSIGAEAVVDDPKLWSPAQPNLWNLDLEVPGESSYRARVGLRELRVADRKLLLNGRPVELRGASVHEDVYGRGDALRPKDQDAIVIGLKGMHANATRSQHPIHPALLERLDAAGIMVWQGVGPTDAPGAWTSRGAKRLRTARDRVRTTVRQAQLNPSVITWNLANEVAGNGHPAGQIPYIDSMAAELKRSDPSRPVALDIWGAHPPKRTSRIYRDIDMIGWTNYIGWYESTFADAGEIQREIRARLGQLRRVFGEKVIAVTEFGAEANGRNATNAPGGYDFQRSLIALHLRTYSEIADIAGALVWNLRDFAVAPSFAGGSISRSVPDIKLVRGINQKGLYDLANRPKPALRAVSRRFAASEAAGR